MPKFKKGQSGNPHGRPKGAANKKSITRETHVVEIIRQQGFCPFLEMINISKSNPDVGIRLTACKELAQYILPKLRATELKGNKEEPVSFSLNLSSSHKTHEN